MSLGPHWYVLSRDLDETAWHVYKSMTKVQARLLADSLEKLPDKRIIVGYGEVFS